MSRLRFCNIYKMNSLAWNDEKEFTVAGQATIVVNVRLDIADWLTTMDCGQQSKGQS